MRGRPITLMITDRIGLHSVLLLLHIGNSAACYTVDSQLLEPSGKIEKGSSYRKLETP